MQAPYTKEMTVLKYHRAQLTRQQFKTLKGQLIAGDADGAMKGLKRILNRSQKNVLAKST